METPPSETGLPEHRRLGKLHGLAAFSPDALASIGYADQEIYLGLMIGGSLALAYALPIAFAITGLLAILALSYYQIIQKYPSGGGSYEVARKTLGTTPGLAASGRPDCQLHAERGREPDNWSRCYCLSFLPALAVPNLPVAVALSGHNSGELERYA